MKTICMLGAAIALLLTASCCTKKAGNTSLFNAVESDTVNQNQWKQALQENNHFSFRFFRQVLAVEKEEINFCVSPVSASWALSMAANGAAGETQKQIMETLGFRSTDIEYMNLFQKKLTKNLLAADSSTVINIANSVWIREGFPVHPAFTQSCERYYDAQVEVLPFDQAAKERINRWCAQKTQGRIDKMIDQIDANMVMYLLNALYFKGVWDDPFAKRATAEAPFTKEDGTSVNVQMMTKEPFIPYFENELLQTASLSFGNGRFRMSFLLPRKGVSLDSLATNLTAESWDEWSRRKMETQKIEIYLPRFTMEYGITLNDILRQLGMPQAFEAGKADFANLSEIPLHIDEVKQKTFIKVDETGAEAAAVTSVGIRAMALPPAAHPILRLDRPFFFILQESGTGAILFTGKVGEPEE